MEVLAKDYKIMLTATPPIPEVKLAKAVVTSWYQTLLVLSRKKKLSRKELAQWKQEISWPDTDSARFWVEGVLKGNLLALKRIRDEFVEARKRLEKKQNM